MHMMHGLFGGTVLSIALPFMRCGTNNAKEAPFMFSCPKFNLMFSATLCCPCIDLFANLNWEMLIQSKCLSDHGNIQIPKELLFYVIDKILMADLYGESPYRYAASILSY